MLDTPTPTPTLTLAERMKQHENVYRTHLPRRTYTIIRVDGRSFSAYTRHLTKPFDDQFADDMDTTATALCADITGTALAYVQSDEISVILTDFTTPTTQPWMGGNAAKLVSLSAATATAYFNQARPTPAPGSGLPTFDSRVFTLDTHAEVINYLLWRQRDAMKNAVSMAASAHFSENRLHGLTTAQRRDLLAAEAGINFDDYAPGHRRGRIMSKIKVPDTATFTRRNRTQTIEVLRNTWAVSVAEPFTHDKTGFMHTHLPQHPDQSPDGL